MRFESNRFVGVDGGKLVREMSVLFSVRGPIPIVRSPSLRARRRLSAVTVRSGVKRHQSCLAPPAPWRRIATWGLV